MRVIVCPKGHRVEIHKGGWLRGDVVPCTACYNLIHQKKPVKAKRTGET